VALKVTGTSFNVISLLGLVLLGGVVVGNGIVLMEYINQLRSKVKKCVPRYGKQRVPRTRPGSCPPPTTIMGMLPIALVLEREAGTSGASCHGPQWASFSSTVLTLIRAAMS